MDEKQQIAVTGGTGLVGSYLLRYLVGKGYPNIRASARPSSNLALVKPVEENIEWRTGDVRDIVFLDDFVADADIVIHCAGLVSFAGGDRDRLAAVNIDGTAHMVNACLAQNVSMLIHISSTSALGKGADLVDETIVWKSGDRNTPYAISKYRSELEVFRGYAEGLDVRIVNPAIVLGGGFWEESSADLFPKIAQGVPFYPRGGSGFVDVRDVAKTIESVGRKGRPGERYLCCGGHLSHRELMEIVAEELDVPPPSYALQNWMIPLISSYFKIASVFGANGSSVTRQSLSTAQKNIRFDASKSREELGMQYRPLEDTIRETARQFSRSEDRGFGYLALD